MSRSNADLLQLKSELTNDPKTLGLDTNLAHDEANADKLNLVRGPTDAHPLSIKKRSLSTADIFNAVDPIEHQALTDQQSRWFDALLSLGQIDPFSDTQIITGLDQMFASDSDSRPAYTALLSEPGNRIDQMFQAGLLEQGGTVTPSDVAQARAAT